MDQQFSHCAGAAARVNIRQVKEANETRRLLAVANKRLKHAGRYGTGSDDWELAYAARAYLEQQLDLIQRLIAYSVAPWFEVQQ